MSSKTADTRPVALTIAGFDPTGGAGVIADVKTFSALGCYGLSVITAITVQDTVKVHDSYPLAADTVVAQLQKLADDIKISAIKIGMLGDEKIAAAVAELLAGLPPVPVVLDPLIYSSSGYPLASAAARPIIIERLLPLVTLVTPNLAEAELLTGSTITDLAGMEQAARRLKDLGAQAVLVKGGHLEGEAADLLLAEEVTVLRSERIAAAPHGTGCALSAAIAAYLAHGSELPTAVAGAKQFITSAIEGAEQFGQGAPLLDHFRYIGLAKLNRSI